MGDDDQITLHHKHVSDEWISFAHVEQEPNEHRMDTEYMQSGMDVK